MVEEHEGRHKVGLAEWISTAGCFDFALPVSLCLNFRFILFLRILVNLSCFLKFVFFIILICKVYVYYQVTE